MRKTVSGFVFSILICAACVCYAEQDKGKRSSGGNLVGTWIGTWEGDGGGKFQMTIAQEAGQKLVGEIAAQPADASSYTAKFKSISFEGNQMTAKYDFPGAEPPAEVIIEGTLKEDTAQGEWTIRFTGRDSGDKGSWQARRK